LNAEVEIEENKIVLLFDSCGLGFIKREGEGAGGGAEWLAWEGPWRDVDRKESTHRA
jgi:hypothetical protein